MTVAELAQIINVQRLEIHPGETLIVQLERSVSMREFDSIAELIKDRLGDIKVLVVGPEFNFKVVAKAGEREFLRAAPRPELGTKNYSIDAVGREGGKASTETR